VIFHNPLILSAREMTTQYVKDLRNGKRRGFRRNRSRDAATVYQHGEYLGALHPDLHDETHLQSQTAEIPFIPSKPPNMIHPETGECVPIVDVSDPFSEDTPQIPFIPHTPPNRIDPNTGECVPIFPAAPTNNPTADDINNSFLDDPMIQEMYALPATERIAGVQVSDYRLIEDAIQIEHALDHARTGFFGDENPHTDFTMVHSEPHPADADNADALESFCSPLFPPQQLVTDEPITKQYSDFNGMNDFSLEHRVEVPGAALSNQLGIAPQPYPSEQPMQDPMMQMQDPMGM